ncbi:4-hydroxybenzoate 3-monooxygenase [Glycomyces harbinensis]|uniref:p-hydroxybenzoate 3-monooxygenase n=1 Tax=Glycomyces harbinensis TaxID=58114 RepID=A0A1G6TJX6_9ACTN|nr:4-hydroxybenzoate 3-monooxygenase [Glycomyces harbinensis]SDD29398.1 p-hydroxybenzoate 3-monooxygenase [Glycomyces harbinensis]
MKARVGIIGAGPAGLLLALLLHRSGIDSFVVERRSRAHCESRVRAGVLEQGTVDTLTAAGVGERMLAEGHVHHGIELRFGGRGHRIAFEDLVPGRAITVYGQQEVVKDLIAANLAAGVPIRFEADDVAVHDIDGDPFLTFGADRLDCDVIAGCDGFHGVSRASVPANRLRLFEKTYRFAWLGVLADVAPSASELVYSASERGFSLHSMRSDLVSRFYLQVPPDARAEDWTHEAIWAELKARHETVPGFTLATGPIREVDVAVMRSFVVEPMRFGRLFLAGDAAHIVPPTGAKGLNLAVADVRVLAAALGEYCRTGSEAGLDAYSATCLRRVWRVQHFSSWMTSLLHRFGDGDGGFDRRIQRARLEGVVRSRAQATVLAENYVGLPYEDA